MFSRMPVLTLALVALLGGSSSAATAPPKRFETALQWSGDKGLAGMTTVRNAGASKVRLTVRWSGIEKSAPTKTSDPADPAYDWTSLDGLVKAAVAGGLDPFVTVLDAPDRVQMGAFDSELGDLRPNPRAFGDFALAITRRYSGSYEGLPRVRYWQVWNEPNVTVYLRPQFEGGRSVAPRLYRDLVNAFARAAHTVRRDNVVIAGGLTPFTIRVGEVHSIAPLRFMRELLCVSGGEQPRRVCSAKVEFDAWAHNPYTSGGPTHKAAARDDVSLGDLPEMKRLLDAAARLGSIRSARPPGFWVSEFSWDSSPQDPKGVPLALHARWVAEALYRMWAAGVEVVTWHQIWDLKFPLPFQSGLYAENKPKPALTAFRFPFVAFKEGSRVFVWGRTPTGAGTRVTVERRTGTSWRTIATLRATRDGIFSARLPVAVTSSDFLRARDARSKALPFSLRAVPDRRFNPFGT